MGKSKLPLFPKMRYRVRFRCRRTGRPVFSTMDRPFGQQAPLPPGSVEGLDYNEYAVLCLRMTVRWEDAA